MMTGGWAALLYLGGLILILAEFLIPGLVAGTLGFIMIVASAVMVAMLYPDSMLLIIPAEVLGVFTAIAAGMYVLRTRAGKGLVLDTTQEGYVAADSDTALLNARGTVFTALRPAGTILVNGKRIDAVANGFFIDKGSAIRVIEVHGSRVVVEPDDGPATS